ncbi:SDH family Clp fold serine proteinase [Ralstonia insidiosa]|uniref:SDH family Clp fold serine proteinase n=1 Tax=Ralstonia insidiosa TaxID=190721 RepID=UPI000CEF2184|nr:serine dehydrogenasease [Ralstonia insidiosa]
MRQFDNVVIQALEATREKLEAEFEADVLAYYGPIASNVLPAFRNALERIVEGGGVRRARLAIFLNTGGGEVEAVERMVEMTRRWYAEVYFVVPNLAMSAGTIFCMSGERIFLDYSSALGPIDPQVQNKDGRWVPALGYLDKFEEILARDRAGQLTQTEFAIAQNQDLAMLRRYEQARDLSVSLLKKWLVEYKFKNWTRHRTDQARLGQEVTLEEKNERAAQIAGQLGDNNLWHSHGRMIGIETLKTLLRLEIDDYTDDGEKRELINTYHDIIVDYSQRQNWQFVLHAKNVFS